MFPLDIRYIYLEMNVILLNRKQAKTLKRK